MTGRSMVRVAEHSGPFSTRREGRHDARNPAGHRNDSAGRGCGRRGRVAEPLQPGTSRSCRACSTASKPSRGCWPPSSKPRRNGARADIATFRANAAVRGVIDAHFNDGIDPVDHLSEKTWRERLADAPRGRGRSQPDLREISRHRLPTAAEYLRVDRSGPNGAVRDRSRRSPAEQGRALLLPGRDQAAPKTRSMFLRSIWTSTTATIQLPYVPTLRVAAPLFGSDHRLFGIVVVNVDMRQVLDRIRITSRAGRTGLRRRPQRRLLVHPDRTREFGSQLGTPTRWQDDFPYFADVTGSTQGVTHVVPESDGKPSGTAIAPAILAEGQWVGIIRVVPYAVFMAPGRHHRADEPHDRHHRGAGRGRARRAAGAIADPADRATHRGGRGDRAWQAGHDSDRRRRRDRRAGAGLCPHGRGDARRRRSALEHEVEERRRTEAARDQLAVRERLFSAAVESSDDSIVMQSLDGIIIGLEYRGRTPLWLFGRGSGRAIDLDHPSARPPR